MVGSLFLFCFLYIPSHSLEDIKPDKESRRRRVAASDRNREQRRSVSAEKVMMYIAFSYHDEDQRR